MQLKTKNGDLIIEDNSKYVTYEMLIKECYYNYIDIKNIILKDVNLSNAILTYMDLYDIIFKESRFCMSNLKNTTFKNCDFSRCDFTGAYLKNTKFINCDLSHCDFSGACLEGCIFDNCNTNNIFLIGAILLLTDYEFDLDNFYDNFNYIFEDYKIKTLNNKYVLVDNYLYRYGIVISDYDNIEKMTKEQIKEHYKTMHNKDIEIID